MKTDSLILLPAPCEVRLGNAIVPVDPGGDVEVPEAAGERFRRAVGRWLTAVRDDFGRLGKPVGGDESKGRWFLRLRLAPEEVAEQGYTLTIRGAGVVVEAGDEAGAFYGLQTLRQILRQTGSDVPELSIHDYPDFPNRGTMLDVSRCKVPRMESLYVLVDRLAEMKFNQLQLYMEHTFAFPGHETVWAESSPFTAAEIRALDAYCTDRYIELAPNLNSFGHMERWLRHPEYHHLAESPGGFIDPWGKKRPVGSTLKPNDDSIAFLDSLYREFLPSFTSSTFNIGCDETWELGQGWSRPLVEEKGASRVYVDFLLKIHALVEKHGRRAQFWGDIILKQPEYVAELPKSLTGMIWGYEADHPFEQNCRTFNEARVPFHVVPGTSSWRSLTGRTDNALASIRSSATHGSRFGADGLLVTEWGDEGHHQFSPIGLPGIAYAAAVSWCLDSNRDLPLADAMDLHLFGSASAGVAAPLLELGTAYRLTGKEIPNGTLFHRLLFAPRDELGGILEGVSDKSLHEADENLAALSRTLSQARPACDDGDLIVEEIILNIRMARHGLRRGLAHLARKSSDRTALHKDLTEITASFEYLWLARNRAGGLRESTGHLRGTAEGYR